MNGPPDVITRLFDAHANRLYRLARRLVPSADDALDLVQETFLKAARSRASIPLGTTADEEAWLVRVLVNIRRDEWRRDSVRRRHDRAEARAALERDPEPAYVARSTVWSALDTLPPRRRAVIVMHELEELPTAAIASLLGISVVTVRWHLSRGRRELARRLGVHEGAIDEHSEDTVAGRRPAASRTTGA
jgi:RNA polymerase sigma-70 factor (ECF subfamily)